MVNAVRQPMQQVLEKDDSGKHLVDARAGTKSDFASFANLLGGLGTNPHIVDICSMP